jgi:hypothetical protein
LDDAPKGDVPGIGEVDEETTAGAVSFLLLRDGTCNVARDDVEEVEDEDGTGEAVAFVVGVKDEAEADDLVVLVAELAVVAAAAVFASSLLSRSSSSLESCRLLTS